MTMSLTFAFLLIVLFAAASWLSVRMRPSHYADSYRSTKPLSQPEQSLYWRLREAMPDCVVLCQVSLSRFLTPNSSRALVRRALFNRISQKSVDFLICLPDFTIIAVVELDDSTHRQEKDARRDSIFQSASVPLVRVNVRDIPGIEELKALFTN
jgi:hypothetical protein